MHIRLVLVGLSGTGKSTICREVASRLSWQALDIDTMIEERAGKSIREIFSQDGEEAFRGIERKLLSECLALDHVVIATGGGAVIREEVWTTKLLAGSSTLVVHLDATSDVIVTRLCGQAAVDGRKAERPLLAEGNPLDKIDAQREARDLFYRRADISLDVGGRTIEAIANDLAELVALTEGNPSRVALTTTSSPSRIDIGPGVRHQVGATIRDHWPRVGRVWVCVDENLQLALDQEVTKVLGLDGLDARVIKVAPGESSKSVSGVGRLWDWLLESGVDRSDVLVAFGGGVVGDLAGFAAATVLRGIGFVQVPSTLLSMVDSSVGGKTGINHPTGKNLIGSFYQPARVVVDTELLRTLPDREFRSGWAEVIKHGVIEPSTPHGEGGVLLDILERNREALLRKDVPLLPWVIRRNISLKAAVVKADEREANMRAILNFGHTIGHGIEASGYRLFHGEAVAVGMVAALNIAVQTGRMDETQAQRIVRLIDAFDLPTTAIAEPGAVRNHMAHDKKKSGGKQLWVLPSLGGTITTETGISDDVIDQAIAAVVRPR